MPWLECFLAPLVPFPLCSITKNGRGSIKVATRIVWLHNNRGALMSVLFGGGLLQ